MPTNKYNKPSTVRGIPYHFCEFSSVLHVSAPKPRQIDGWSLCWQHSSDVLFSWSSSQTSSSMPLFEFTSESEERKRPCCAWKGDTVYTARRAKPRSPSASTASVRYCIRRRPHCRPVRRDGLLSATAMRTAVVCCSAAVFFLQPLDRKHPFFFWCT